MAGLSLMCGDCGHQLRSVQEAQEHAELTGHANFSESTEAVLNLVCTACGKPCRSKTETDLHTKRTGHSEFTDKTEEAAKPIDLESKSEPLPSSSEPVDGEDIVIFEGMEMVRFSPPAFAQIQCFREERGDSRFQLVHRVKLCI